MRNHIEHSLNYTLFIFLLCINLTGCHKDPYHVSTENMDLNLEINRFETELFSADPSVIEEYIPEWENNYNIFFRHFNYVLNLGNSSDPGYAERLKNFVSNSYHYKIYQRTMEVFPDLENILAEFTDAFKRYQYFFPDHKAPRIITFVSGFNQTAISDDNLLAIGLDKYLGRDEPLYQEVGVYQYLLQNMYPEKIVPDCMMFWAETEFTFNDSINNLISNMIYKGRQAYLAHALLPDKADTLIWGFSNEDIHFCMNNEKQMWTYLVSNKLLFNTDRFTINKFILEGPFTNDFGKQSPARAANWIGYKIVERFMKKNPDLTLQELMEKEDYMDILNLSAYNP